MVHDDGGSMIARVLLAGAVVAVFLGLVAAYLDVPMGFGVAFGGCVALSTVWIIAPRFSDREIAVLKSIAREVDDA